MKITDMKVDLIDSMGNDLTVVNAARVSFDKESSYKYRPVTEGYPQDVDWVLSEKDAKLIKYLATHNHWTPFGHCSATLRVKAPIFVARQLGKHQVGFVWNEVSRRYVDSEPEFFLPEFWRRKADNVKQGSSEEEVDLSFIFEEVDDEGSCVFMPEEISHKALILYNTLLKSGVCPEQARMVLPQNMMTEWYWTGSLAGWARVCQLRLDPHTQKETRDVAQMISDIMKSLYPVSWEALSA